MYLPISADKSFVRDTKNFPFTGLAPNGYSELDAGVDVGGPIIKNRLTFFAAFNPQFRTNSYLTQTFRGDGQRQDQDAVLFGQAVVGDQQ